MLKICYDHGEERSGSCYTVRKGIIYPHNRKNFNYHPNDAFNITHELSNIYSLVKIFNKYKYFYSYDGFTHMLHIAALCGCIPIVIPDEGVSKEEFIKNTPVNKYGIAYGIDDIEYAKSTLHLVKPHLQHIESDGVESVKQFVTYCYNHLNIKKQN